VIVKKDSINLKRIEPILRLKGNYSPGMAQPLHWKDSGNKLKFLTMKKISLLLSILVIVFTVQAQKREKRDVSNFTSISFKVGGKMYLKQGSVNSVELEGDDDVLEKIETRVEGGKLIVGREDESSWFNWRSGWDDEKITAYVTVKDLDGLYASGSGSIIAQTKLVGDNMDIKVSGSGNIEAEIDAADVDAKVSGSGDLMLKGKARSMDSDISGSGKISFDGAIAGRLYIGISGSGRLYAAGSADEIKSSISGSGKVNAADLVVDKCDVRISGSGDVVVNVKSVLRTNISGSGSVTYRGNPSQLDSNSSGSGRLRKM
jgi:hypothetical protein